MIPRFNLFLMCHFSTSQNLSVLPLHEQTQAVNAAYNRQTELSELTRI